MVKLDRYIGKSVFLAILAVTGIILGLASLFAFIDEVKSVSDTYTIMDVFSFVMLTAPRRMYEMLPIAALIGCLIGLGSLASNSELTIMRAAGVSTGQARARKRLLRASSANCAGPASVASAISAGGPGRWEAARRGVPARTAAGCPKGLRTSDQ